MPSILFNSLVKFTANCRSLLDITFFSKLYNFHMLSLNNYNSSSVVVLFVVTKYVIFDNLLHTTIAFFSTTNGNFVIKSTTRYIHSFFSILFTISFSARGFIQFLILWHRLHPFIYLPISLVTLSHQQFLVTNSVIFYFPLCLATSIL